MNDSHDEEEGEIGGGSGNNNSYSNRQHQNSLQQKQQQQQHHHYPHNHRNDSNNNNIHTSMVGGPPIPPPSRRDGNGMGMGMGIGMGISSTNNSSGNNNNNNNTAPFQPRPRFSGRGGRGGRFHDGGRAGDRGLNSGRFAGGGRSGGGNYRGGGRGRGGDHNTSLPPPPPPQLPPFRGGSSSSGSGGPSPFRETSGGGFRDRNGNIATQPHRDGYFGGRGGGGGGGSSGGSVDGPPIPFRESASLSTSMSRDGPSSFTGSIGRGGGGGGSNSSVGSGGHPPSFIRESSFSRDRDGPLPPRSGGGGGGGGNGGPGLFRGGGGSRDKFGDNSRPSTFDGPVGNGAHLRRGSSGSLPSLSTAGVTSGPQDPRRPTDPRRRSSQDTMSGSSKHNSGNMGDGVGMLNNNHGPPRPGPQPRGRIASHSSLGDIPSTQMSSKDPIDQGFRSPGTIRRHGFPERGTSGPPDSRLHIRPQDIDRRPSWSPANDRLGGRGMSPRSINSNLTGGGYHKAKEGGSIPLAPPLSSRQPMRLDLHSRNRSFTEGENIKHHRQNHPSPRSSPNKVKSMKSFVPSGSSSNLVSGPSSLGTKVATMTKTSTSKIPRVVDQSLEKTKPPEVTIIPLLTSSLGDDSTVQRAKESISNFAEVLGITHDDKSKLPEKAKIMAAISAMDSKLKQTQTDLESTQESLKTQLENEKVQEEEEKKRLEGVKEQERLAAVEEEKKQKMATQKLKEEGLQQAIEAQKAEHSSLRKQFDKDLEVKVQKAIKERKEEFDLDSKVAVTLKSFEKDITKAQNLIEKAQTQVSQVEAKLDGAQTKFDLLSQEVQGMDHPSEASSEGKRGNVPKMSAIEQIMADNRRKAGEAQSFAFAMTSESDGFFDNTGGAKDPLYGKTCEEWSVLTKQVNGVADALYSDPSEAPYFSHNQKSHTLLEPYIREHIRDQKQQLVKEWTVLSEEYEVRKRLYEKQQRKLAKKAQRASSVSVSRTSIFGGGEKESPATGVAQGIDRSNILESGSRTSSNPYRRARRGNEVRSEYEQEQIIAELAAKEAMEKRITHGGCKLPHQVSPLERGFTATFIHTFESHRIDDPKKEAEESQMDNLWTDMEKCIFLDRFLQFPKDFRRIASFLRNKTTKDCITFYYDSKQTVPYKAALKEHIMRRKRKGDYDVWDASIQAAISVGATVVAGSSEEKPVEFLLPSCDKTYRTYRLHPLRRETLDPMQIDTKAARKHEKEMRAADNKGKSKKRHRDALFSLDRKATKFLRQTSQEYIPPIRKVEEAKDVGSNASLQTPVRKAPQKWTAAEKKIFVDTLEQHGRDWAKLAEAVGTKNEKQIKNFYYDWKKGKSRPVSEKKAKREKLPKAGKLRKPADQGKVRVPLAEGLSDSKTEESDVVSLPLVPEKQESTNVVAQSANVKEVLDREHESLQGHSLSGSATPEGDFTGNTEMIQQLLSQQLQQQQQQQQQQQHQHLHSQNAFQQLLNQHQLQREQQLGHLSMEDARRILSQQQHQQQQSQSSTLSNLFAGSQWMLQGQGTGLPSNSITAALRGEGNNAGGNNDLSDLQRLLQLQRASQQGIGISNHQGQLASLLLGRSGDLGGAAGNNLSAALLQQFGGNANTGHLSEDQLSSLANAQSLLGIGGGAGAHNNSLANALYQANGGNIDSNGISDAFSYLARSMHRGDGNGFDGTGRFN